MGVIRNETRLGCPDEVLSHLPHVAGSAEMMERPSQFLNEVPKALLEEWQIGGGF